MANLLATRSLLIAGVCSLPIIAYGTYTSMNTRKLAQYERLLQRAATTECRFRLDNETSAVLTLPDGRKLGYAQYGSPTGRAIIYCHGLPGSRIEAAGMHDPAIECGARIIAVDRSGFGWSSPHPHRTIADHVKDIQVLTKHLGLQEYAVLVKHPSRVGFKAVC